MSLTGNFQFFLSLHLHTPKRGKKGKNIIAEWLLVIRANVIKTRRFLHVDNFVYKFAFKCVLNRTENAVREGDGEWGGSERQIAGYVRVLGKRLNACFALHNCCIMNWRIWRICRPYIPGSTHTHTHTLACLSGYLYAFWSWPEEGRGDGAEGTSGSVAKRAVNRNPQRR